MTYSPFAFTDTSSEVFYPEDDGKPMAENTKQYRWIVIIKENLEILFSMNLDVFIAGDLLWYPIQGDNVTCTAPDVMVVVGRPKGDRRSYKQWEERNIPPTVVFEIMSPSNTQREMAEKRAFYEQHGVDEFYVYDPDRNRLNGYVRQGGELLPILNLEGWVSPSLKIQFRKHPGEMEIYYPDGRRFLTTLEFNQQAIEAEQQAIEAESRATVAEDRATVAEDRATVAEDRATVAESRATVAEERVNEAEERAIAAEQERDRLMAQLRALGFNPEGINPEAS